MERRKFMASSAGTISLAGCADVLGTNSGPPKGEHFGTDGLENQPTFGKPPSKADNLVVAFEDPSCAICADFHADGYEDLRSELIDSNEIGYVKRHVGIVEDWAGYASGALLATYERDVAAYRDLVGNLFRFSVGNEQGVRAQVENTLSEYDGVDADAVIQAADDGEYEDVVAANEEALDRSDADDVPSFLLYGAGNYRTALTGDQEYDVFEKHLEV